MNNKMISNNEKFDNFHKNFIVFTNHKVPYNFDEIDISSIDGANRYNIPLHSDDDAVDAEIWAGPSCNSSLFILSVNVVAPVKLITWNDYQISTYVNKIIDDCVELNKVANLLPVYAQEKADEIFRRIEQVKEWLLEVKTRYIEYLDINGGEHKKQEIGFR